MDKAVNAQLKKFVDQVFLIRPSANRVPLTMSSSSEQIISGLRAKTIELWALYRDYGANRAEINELRDSIEGMLCTLPTVGRLDQQRADALIAALYALPGVDPA